MTQFLFRSVSFAALALAVAGGAQAQDDATANTTAPTEPSIEGSVFDGDWVTLGLGAGYRPSYDGSDDYVVIPAPIIQGNVSGFDFGARGPGLYVDVIRDGESDNKVKLLFGPQVHVRLDRNSQIKDAQVKLLGKRDVAVEMGFTSGISLTGVTNPYDRLTFGVDAGWDVAGAHKGYVITPSISFSTPLSKASLVNLTVSADHIDDKFANYYYSIDSLGATASGLPAFAAKGGWKDVGATLVGGYDLSGNALDGGWGVFALANYSRMMDDAKRSPVTSIRGSADQWFVAAGISYTF
jgi:MipA family protein